MTLCLCAAGCALVLEPTDQRIPIGRALRWSLGSPVRAPGKAPPADADQGLAPVAEAGVETGHSKPMPPPEAERGAHCALRDDVPATDCARCHASGAHATSDAPRLRPGHPVDLDYASVTASKAFAYRKPTQLPAEVRLEGGRITCLSCHAARSQHAFRTTLEGRGALCVACHVV